MEPGQVSTEIGGAHHHDFLPGQGSPAFCGVDLWLTPRVEELKPRRDLRRLPKEFHTLSTCTCCSHLEIWTVFPLRRRVWQSLTRCFCDYLRAIFLVEFARAARTWKSERYFHKFLGWRVFRVKTRQFSDSVQLDVESQRR